MTNFQMQCCEALLKSPNGIAGVGAIATRLKSSRVGVHAAMRSLERQGLAHHFPSDRSQWAVSLWYVTLEGEQEIKRLSSPATIGSQSSTATDVARNK